MDTRRTRRKRRNSSVSNIEPSSSALRSDSHGSKDAARVSSYETPRQTKRVRFSDPGPRLGHGTDHSTGLTPALLRTSFEEPQDERALNRTPSRRMRRRSTPLPRYSRAADSPLPSDKTPLEGVLQFAPLRQILDSRTQRRIRRSGLSSEITSLEREKRSSAQYEKALQSLLRERDSLKQELEWTKRDGSSPESRSTDGERDIITDDAGIQLYGSENDLSKVASLVTTFHNESPLSNGELDTIMINDSGFEGDTFLVSDSPDIRGLDIQNHTIPDDLSLLSQRVPRGEASVQTSQPCCDQKSEFLDLARDLEAARREKKDLFEACRSNLSSIAGTALENHLHQPSPPPDFLGHVLSTLTQTLASVSDAASTLKTIQQELSSLGFPGGNIDDIITEMRDRFRSARLELELAVPGETANADLDNGGSTLSALVKRIEILVKSLDEEQKRHQGSVSREKALRNQFDNLLSRYEAASEKVHSLEDSITSSAGDMLHTRMRMQDLEREIQDHVIGIDRLNAALGKYHDEVKGLETLVNKMEDDKLKCNAKHDEEISKLKLRIAEDEKARLAAKSNIAEREALIRELDKAVGENKTRICDLTAKIEILERDRKTVESLEQKAVEEAQRHEQEVGLMNVRASETNTMLELAKTEVEKLRRCNSGLEEQLRLEVETRDSLLDKWAAEQARAFTVMKETVNTERRRAKIRVANWELKSDELQSNGMAIGSEPITPISMTRFVDVEVGRGKHRRRLDSGIGILTEDEFEEADNGYDDQQLPSDPADL